MTIEEKRDEAANEYCNSFEDEGFLRLQTQARWHAFKAGWDAGVNARDEQIQILTEALEFYAKQNWDWESEPAKQALGKVKEDSE